MDITIQANDLNAALNRVRGAVEARTTIPILANVLLTAAQGRLSLRGTDLDMEVTTKVVADVKEEGETTVNAERLRQIASKLDKGVTVTLRLSDGNLMVKAGRSNFKLPTLPPVDFPKMSVGDNGDVGNAMWRFDLTGAQIADVFGRTQFAISTEETRYYLNGIYFHQAGESLRGVATDGHRLAQVDLAMPAGGDGMKGVIVPRKTVTQALSLADKADVITVSLTESKIGFTIGETTLVSKLIDGTFPDYQRVIPTGNDKIMVADKKTLAAASGRVATVSSERGRAVKFSLTEGRLVLSVHSVDTGDAEEEVDVEYDGQPIDLGLNSAYFAAIVAEINSDKVEMRLADPGSPTLIKGIGDDAATYVCMPLRVN